MVIIDSWRVSSLPSETIWSSGTRPPDSVSGCLLPHLESPQILLLLLRMIQASDSPFSLFKPDLSFELGSFTSLLAVGEQLKLNKYRGKRPSSSRPAPPPTSFMWPVVPNL